MLALLLSVLLGLAAAPAPSASAAGDAVRIAVPARSMSFSAIYVGQGKKFFEEQGLDLRVSVVAGIGALQAMLAGSTDFTGLTGTEVIKAHTKGLTPVVIAAGIERMSMEIIADKEKATAAGVTESSSLQEKLRFMKGRTIGVLRTGAVAHFFLLYAAARGGLDPKTDLSIVSLGTPPALFASLEKKQIDAFVFVPPISVIPVVKGYGLRLASGPLNTFPEIAPFPYISLLTMAKTAQENPGLTRRMTHAFVKGLRHIHSHPEESAALVKAQFKDVPEPVLNESLRLVLPSHSKDGRITLAAMETAQKFLLDGGAIDKPVDLSKTFTNDFLPKE